MSEVKAAAFIEYLKIHGHEGEIQNTYICWTPPLIYKDFEKSIQLGNEIYKILKEKLMNNKILKNTDYIWVEFSKEIPPENLPIFLSNGDNLVPGVYVKDHNPDGWHWDTSAMLTNDDLTDVGNYEYNRNIEFKYWTYQPIPPNK